MAHHHYRLPDGRQIGVTAIGEPAATRLIVLCLPTPGAAGFDPDPTVTVASGYKVVEIDRPGYGGSDALPTGQAPTVELFADDIAEFLRHTLTVSEETVGIAFGTVGVIGWSFGGAIALALAARHPDLVDSVVLVGTPTPSRLRKGERYSSVMELRKHGVERGVTGLQSSLEQWGPVSFNDIGVDDDDPAFGPLGVRGRVERMLETAWTKGAAGVASDRIAVRDDGWAGALDDVRARTLLLYGGQDLVASADDADWYEKHLADTTRADLPDSGHLVIVPEWPHILEFIGPGQGRLEDPTGERG